MDRSYFPLNNSLFTVVSEETKEKFTRYLFNLHKVAEKLPSEFDYLNFVENPFDHGLYFYILFCPICKTVKLFTSEIPSFFEDAKFCLNCKYSNIHSKAEDGFHRIKTLKLHTQLSNQEVEIIFNQQLLTMVSTTMETFLKDFYKTLLNIIYVKPGKSLARRFGKEAKNDFLNWGKTFSIFYNDFDIDMKAYISNEERKFLNECTELRNVIIHNNGFADEKLINNYSNKYKLGKPIILKDEDITKYIRISQKLIVELEKIYNVEFTTEMRDIFVHHLEELLLTNTYYYKIPNHHGYTFIHKNGENFEIEYIRKDIFLNKSYEKYDGFCQCQ